MRIYWKLLADSARSAAAYSLDEGLVRRGSNEEVEIQDERAYLEDTIAALGELVGVRLAKYRIARGRAQNYDPFLGESRWKHLVNLAMLDLELRNNDLLDPRIPTRFAPDPKQMKMMKEDLREIVKATAALGKLVGENLRYD